MRQSAVALAVVAATASSSYYSALAFQAFHAKQRHGVASSSVASSTTSSALTAFRLKDGETQNMFEGPLPLVKERDACGVGFIANVNSGGELLLRWCTSCEYTMYCAIASLLANTHPLPTLSIIIIIDQTNLAPTKSSNKAYAPSTAWSTVAPVAAMASRATVRAS